MVTNESAYASAGLDPLWEKSSLAVDGLNDVHVVEHTSAFELSAGTLAFRVRPDSVDGRQGLISKDASFLRDGGHLTVWLEDGAILARLQSDHASYQIAGGSVAAGETQSVAVSFGEGGFQLWVGGVLVDENGYEGGIEDNAEPLVIGASQWASSAGTADELTHEFRGTLSDVAMFSKRLGADDIGKIAGAETDTGTGTLSDGVSNVVAGDEAPVRKEASESVNVSEGARETLDLAPFFVDPDGDALSFRLKDAPDFASIKNGDLVLAPNDGDHGNHAFQITATDGSATSAALNVDTTVWNAIQSDGDSGSDAETDTGSESDTAGDASNEAPVRKAASESVSVSEGARETLDLAPFFVDPDGDALSFRLKDAPDFASIKNGDLVLAPNDGDHGNHAFQITATDGSATSAALNVDTTVWNAIQSDTSSGSDSGGSTDDGVDESSGGTTTDTTSSGKLIKLVAGDLDGGTGPKEWGEGVVLRGYGLKGEPASVRYVKATDPGFGIDSDNDRFHAQIDYFEWGGSRSEKMVIDFNGDVTDVALTVGMMGDAEGPDDYAETGLWKAYNENGKLVGKGLLGPDIGTKTGGYGQYEFDIDVAKAFERLEIEATQFDHGQGDSFRLAYGENSSEFNVMAVEFARLEPVDDFLF